MWFGTKRGKDPLKLAFPPLWKDSPRYVLPPFLSLATQIIYLPSMHQYYIYLQGLFDDHERNSACL